MRARKEWPTAGEGGKITPCSPPLVSDELMNTLLRRFIWPIQWSYLPRMGVGLTPVRGMSDHFDSPTLTANNCQFFVSEK